MTQQPLPGFDLTLRHGRRVETFEWVKDPDWGGVWVGSNGALWWLEDLEFLQEAMRSGSDRT